MKTVRCAIYTRKSSEEGLEQAFNSLDAQREACAAYVLSQASEGWTALPEVYDDGGLSGGSLERPALRRLLADVADGKVDIIVVYKVDRLTRSLLDFAKLVEAFDKAGTSFVSVTQSFNTTTSMGRLTLNMLLSFAQFEREVTAERIRDKIAASKAKGMWMGGTPPLGYRPDGRSLVIVEEHATIVRDIYRRYLQVGNVRLVAEQLVREGQLSPTRTRKGNGRSFGGCKFTRGQIYFILKNPIYVGDIAHRDKLYAGQHSAIIDRDTWQLVQAKLADHTKGDRRGSRSPDASLLAGLIVDEEGEPLVAAHACKGRIRYRYYISRRLQHPDVDPCPTGIRLPAREIEACVTALAAEAFDDPLGLMVRSGLTPAPSQLPQIVRLGADAAADIRGRGREVFLRVIAQVRVLSGSIEIDLSTRAIADLLHVPLGDQVAATITLTSAVRLTRTGRAVRLVQTNGLSSGAQPDVTLVKLIAKARHWWKQLVESEISISELAAREGVSPSYATRILRLAFLAPEVVDAILRGRHLASLDGGILTDPASIPCDWRTQTRRLLPA
jgi:site-specific DNA recombinase